MGLFGYSTCQNAENWNYFGFGFVLYFKRSIFRNMLTFCETRLLCLNCEVFFPRKLFKNAVRMHLRMSSADVILGINCFVFVFVCSFFYIQKK